MAVILAMAVGLMVAPPGPARAAATFIVNSTGDDADLNLANTRCDTSAASGDQCTLRAAIQEANDTPGPDTISFDIVSADAVKTITPVSALPPITDAVTINGYTQAGASVNTLATGNNAVFKIQLNGTHAGPGADGLKVEASDSVVRGLIIKRFTGDGIRVTGSNNQIKGNLIGTSASGTVIAGNGIHGVVILGPDNVVGGTTVAARNLISGNVEVGVIIAGGAATGNRVQGNYIGTDKGGTNALGNGLDGVAISSAPGNTVGGTASAARNVISGNGASGVSIAVFSGSASVVQGNFIGTDATGTLVVGNGVEGVLIGGSGALIGGTVPGARNVISGNGDDGVQVNGVESLVQGNYVGTDVTGTVALGNHDNGIEIFLRDNTIGGTVAGAGNVISGNGRSGVQIFGSAAPGNKIQGNRIGTKADGTGDLGNVADGVELNGPNTIVGGAVSGAANLISGNGRNGVRIGGGFATGNEVKGNVIRANDGIGASVEFGPNTIGGGNLIQQNGSHGVRVGASATGVRIFPNQIFGNGGLGINLAGGTEDGLVVTANDTDDPDTGANDLQNFPVLTSATRSNATGVTIVTGTLNSNPGQAFTVELFLAVADPSNHGEALVFIASKSVTTNAGGDIGFSFANASLIAGQQLTATATNTAAGNTSEFSSNRLVIPGP